jgi:hypothetical protein
MPGAMSTGGALVNESNLVRVEVGEDGRVADIIEREAVQVSQVRDPRGINPPRIIHGTTARSKA